MHSSRRFLALFLIGSSILAACNMPGGSQAANSGLQVTQTLQALATEVRQTLQAAAPGEPTKPTQTPMSVATSLPPETPATGPTATSTPSSTATDTPTPTAVPATATPSTPNAHVNTNTNCRSGPSTAFNQLYVAVAGEDLKIVSRTTYSDYVLVENPRKPGQTCWLWTQYVDVSGDLSGLPVATPPPTPTPVIDFKLAMIGVNTCSLLPELTMKNNGEVAFKSAHLLLQDKDLNLEGSETTNSFNLNNRCNSPQLVSELDTGQTAYVTFAISTYDPTGHHLVAKFTLCTEADLKGTCVTKQLTFTP